MKFRRMIVLFLILSLCLVGCKKGPDDATTLDEGNDTVSVENSEVPAIHIDKYIWEKEREYFDLSTIKLDKNWNEYIMVGDTTISSTEYVDMSSLSNYFFDEQNTKADLETAYNVPTKGFALMTDANDVDFNFITNLTIKGTTMNHNVLIEGVSFIGFVDPYSDDLNTLMAESQYPFEDSFGIGSTYEQVIGVLGEPSSCFIEPSEDVNTTRIIYKTDKTKMILTFSWVGSCYEIETDGETQIEYDDEAMKYAVLTSLEWTPFALRETLRG